MKYRVSVKVEDDEATDLPTRVANFPSGTTRENSGVSARLRSTHTMFDVMCGIMYGIMDGARVLCANAWWLRTMSSPATRSRRSDVN